ncbi:MAG: WYL domain-containing protein [Verrucomicrobiota bacterium]|nr:WYL domain-containing protein [Verrucomicrobiota bacterium]
MPRPETKLLTVRARPAMERIMQIHQAISGGKYPNCTSLAREMEVSYKSIQRDIDFMRDRLGFPLEFDPVRKGWFYTEEVSDFPAIQISEGEMFALLVAEKALHQYRGTSFEKPLMRAFQKMTESLPDTISIQLSEWDKAVTFRSSVEPVINLEVFNQISKAAADRKQLRINYQKPGAKTAESRLIDPYQLANVNGEWFLFAYDHLRKDIRTFVPARIKNVELTGKLFKRPANFSMEKNLAGSFGVRSGRGEHDVILRFDPEVADYIREKRWHQSQVLRELEGGGVELQFRLSGLEEIQRWILNWGAQVQVVQPPVLADAIREIGRAIVSRYTTDQRIH